MKPHLIALSAAIALSGCMVSNIHSNQAVGSIDSVTEARQLIRPGMTKDQVRAKLGEPNSTYTQNTSTIWSYTHVETDFSGKRLLIPYGPLPNIKAVNVTFNASGRVTSVDFNQQTN